LEFYLILMILIWSSVYFINNTTWTLHYQLQQCSARPKGRAVYSYNWCSRFPQWQFLFVIGSSGAASPGVDCCSSWLEKVVLENSSTACSARCASSAKPCAAYHSLRELFTPSEFPLTLYGGHKANNLEG
jgi:hypothetical protein